MTCIVCGTKTNPTELCQPCLEFFLWRYRDDDKALDLVLDWFRIQHIRRQLEDGGDLE